MAVYRSFKTLMTQTRNLHLSRTFYSLSLSLSSPSPLPRFISPLSPLSRFLSPLSRAPLFLSSPPCMLSQSSTPIYAQSDVVLLPPKVQCLNYLLRSRQLQSLEIQNRTVGVELGDRERRVGSRSEELGGSFVNLPNMISIGRLVSGPFLGWMIVNEMYLPAFIGLGISGASDWLDGFVARRMGINSLVGSYLDPLADKVLIGCVAVAMVDKGLLHPGLVALVVLRDVGLVGGAFYKRASSLDWNWKNWSEFFNIDGMRPEKVEPLFLSKVNTVFQLALVAAALLQPEFGTPETQPYITYLSWLVASTTVATTASYGALYMKNGAFRGKH